MVLDTAALLRGLLGGLLIGLASALLLFTHGRIAGISGILSGALHRPLSSGAWRAWFLGGLLAGGVALSLVHPAVFGAQPPPTGSGLLLLAVAGLLVGLGSRLSHGCTSGHGVCGIGRGQPRSLAATITFVAVGMLTVLFTRAVL